MKSLISDLSEGCFTEPEAKNGIMRKTVFQMCKSKLQDYLTIHEVAWKIGQKFLASFEAALFLSFTPPRALWRASPPRPCPGARATRPRRRSRGGSGSRS